MIRMRRLVNRSALAAAIVGLGAVVAPTTRAGDEAPRAALERRIAALAPDDAAAAYRVALDAEALGAGDLARRAYEAVVRIDPDHLAARRALGHERIGGRWLGGDDAMRAKGFVRHEGRWLSSEELAALTRPERDRAEQREGEARVRALLERIASDDEATVATARRRLAAEDDRFKLAPLAFALRLDSVPLRRYAASELGRLGDERAIPALLKRAIVDPSPEVRVAVADALRAIDSPDTVHPLGRALASNSAEVRRHAAEALGRLGDVAGMGYVLHRWSATSGDFPRAYFASVSQVSYIHDFDVEVAATSFIADPVVGVLQEGVVHPVKVLGVEHEFSTLERVAYEGALKGMSGLDLGSDRKAWMRAWHEEKDRLLAEREAGFRERRERRVAAAAAAE